MHHAIYDNGKRSHIGFGYSGNPKLTETPYERENLVRKIRTLLQYEPHLNAAIKAPSKFVVGKGIFPEPLSGSDEYKTEFKKRFKRWAKNALVCDKGGKLNYVDMQYMIDAGFRRDGEGFVFNQKTGTIPQFQVVDPLLIKSGKSNEGNVRDGIRINENERPLGCFVSDFSLTKNRFSTSQKYVRINNYNHLVNFETPHQVRGRTCFHNSATIAHDLLDILTSEKDAHQTHLGLSAHIKKKKNSTYSVADNLSDNDHSYLADEGHTEKQIEEKTESSLVQLNGAQMIESPDVEEVKLLSSNRNLTGLKDLVEILLRQLAHSSGYTYEFLFDLASLGGVTARIDLEANYLEIERDQDRLINQVLYPLVRFWAASEIKEGRLQDAPEDFWNIGFRRPSKATADIKNNGKNARENIDYRIATRGDAINDSGEGFEDFVKRNIGEIETERRMVSESNLSWEEYTETITKLEQPNQNNEPPPTN